MSELNLLTKQRDELLEKIRTIEANCEGVENEQNVKCLQDLNLKQADLTAQKNTLNIQLTSIQTKLSSINHEIATLSSTGVDRILEAIKNQRWYFFKNKPKVLMDRDTGLLWPNLKSFIHHKNNKDMNESEKELINSTLELDNYSNWFTPTYEQIKEIVLNEFPFLTASNSYIENSQYWFCKCENGHNAISLSNFSTGSGWVAHNLPCNNYLTKDSDYIFNVSSTNPVYTEKERLQFTLDLFIENELLPIFNDNEITQLYKQIYFEKPELMKQLQDLQSQIEDLQKVALLSSDFDYQALLSKYNLLEINHSLIQYSKAIQQWTNELLEKLAYYEEEKESVIRNFNTIGLKLAKKYESNNHLTAEENTLLEERQRYFQKQFALGMHDVQSKLLGFKKQAIEIEYQLDEASASLNPITELAILEQTARPSFELIAENTARIVRNALIKIEYFESHHDFVTHAIQTWETWSENYRVFKTTYKEDLKNSCEEDGIEEAIWSVWYQDWQQLRFAIEEKVQSLIERGLKGDIPTNEDINYNIIETLISVLETYKKAVDTFYLEERKGIYQKFAFQSGGDLQDKFEAESTLYRFVAEFQSALQDVIFSCSQAEDRIFILNWANSLLNIQIDEILDFVANKDLNHISQTILSEFAALKQKNFEIYLADAKTYRERKAYREKQYNSLMFKMRKDLMK